MKSGLGFQRCQVKKSLPFPLKDALRFALFFIRSFVRCVPINSFISFVESSPPLHAPNALADKALHAFPLSPSPRQERRPRHHPAHQANHAAPKSNASTFLMLNPLAPNFSPSTAEQKPTRQKSTTQKVRPHMTSPRRMPPSFIPSHLP